MRKRRRITPYNVYARPRKKIKGRKPKLIKVNKVPLKKSTAKNLRNYITDTSLSRTARIRKTKGKPRTSRLRIPKGYAKRTSKKFRRYKIVKGRRKLLPKGAVIEKRKHLLDTKREKRQITLRRRIKQITKPKRKVTTSRKQIKIKKKIEGGKKMTKITIRKEKIFGKNAYVISKNGQEKEFRYSKANAEKFAKELRKKPIRRKR